MTVPGRCHFDADGWLQGPLPITHLLTPNHGTGFGTGRGVVLHTEAGFEAGTVATFMSPAAKVSAFFSVAQDGSCHQYVPVGLGLTAWSQAAGNDAWRGIEDEDGTHPSIPLTAAQLATFAQILEACSAFDGFPLQVTDDTAGTGLITHGAGGVAWGNHPGCPGPVRAAQRPAIIALATQIRAAVPPPPPPKEPDVILVSVNKAEVPKDTAWPGVFLLDAAGLRHVTSGADVTAYQQAGISGPVTISWGEYQARSAAGAQ